jgi:hypothetical protein
VALTSVERLRRLFGDDIASSNHSEMRRDAMRRGLPPIGYGAMLIGLAACGDFAPPPPAAPLEQIRASFPPGGLVDTIRIDAVERLPLRAVLLVAPDGSTTPGDTPDVVNGPQVRTGQYAAGNPWQGAQLGADAATAAFSPAHTQAMAGLQGREDLLAMVSTANVPLPDAVAYRRDWTHYRVRLIFGTPPNTADIRDIPAPEPPSPQQ